MIQNAMISGELANEVDDIIRAVSDRVIMPRFRSLHEDDVVEKSPGDLATIADHEAEIELSEALVALLPGSVVVGEESVTANPAVLRLLEGSERVWLIDPIDGTRNFVNGSESFGVMVALLLNGVVAASWIWLPTRELMYVAALGQGAFRNRTPLDDSAIGKSPSQMTGTIKRRYLPGALKAKVSATAAGFGAVDIGQFCSAVEYVSLAERESDFILYGRVLPWDHIPGALLVQETGGIVNWTDGSPYVHQPGGVGLLAVADAPNWDAVADVMLGPRARQ